MRSYRFLSAIFILLFIASCASMPNAAPLVTNEAIVSKPEGTSSTTTENVSEEKTKAGTSSEAEFSGETGTGTATGALPPPSPDLDKSTTSDESKKAEAMAELAEAAKKSKSSDDSIDLALKKDSSREAESSASGTKTKPSTVAAAPVPSQSGLKAGFSDDNKQFSYFVNFLDKYSNQVEHYPLKINERILIKVIDADGKSVPNADIEVKSGSKSLTRGKTFADGTFYLFPQEFEKIDRYQLEVKSGSDRKSLLIMRNGRREVSVTLENQRKIANQIPLDICFIMDTTGSMGEEIERLRSTIQIIYTNLSLVEPKPLVRFSMIMYKDLGDDEYRVKTVPFTKDLDAFQRVLNTLDASGGGDTPEDLQAALEAAIQKLSWNSDGVRMCFVVTDAPAHLDYGQSFNYTEAAKEAKAKAIRIHTIGTGGLPLEGEYILRQISQYTSSKYIFLTYGEEGESSGGTVGSVSHHTGSNFATDKLEVIIMRFAKEDLSYLTKTPLTDDTAYYEAQKIESEKSTETLNKLFKDSITNLADYSSFRITKETKISLVPFTVSVTDDAALKTQGEYFLEQAMLASRANALFTMVERKDLQKVLEEIELQYAMLDDEKRTVKLGEILGSEALITGTLYKKNTQYELFLKLIRVETGEILSVIQVKIDEKLAL